MAISLVSEREQRFKYAAKNLTNINLSVQRQAPKPAQTPLTNRSSSWLWPTVPTLSTWPRSPLLCPEPFSTYLHVLFLPSLSLSWPPQHTFFWRLNHYFNRLVDSVPWEKRERKSRKDVKTKSEKRRCLYSLNLCYCTRSLCMRCARQPKRLDPNRTGTSWHIDSLPKLLVLIYGFFKLLYSFV